MTGEELQDQAALYALGLLDAAEAAEFETRLSADADLRTLTRELTDAASALALEAPQCEPPHPVKTRVLMDLTQSEISFSQRQTLAANAARERRWTWAPWAIAAALVAFCGLLVAEQAQLRREVAALQTINPLGEVSVYSLAATPTAPQKAVASVAWDAKRQDGMLRVSNLPPPGAGKDYQLWVITPGVKDPISAGVFHVDERGAGQALFKPTNQAAQAAVFAISVERTGGSPINGPQGPIVLVSGA